MESMQVERKKKSSLEKRVSEEKPLAAVTEDLREFVSERPAPGNVASPMFYLSVIMIATAEYALGRSVEFGILAHSLIIVALAAAIASLHRREAQEKEHAEQFRNTANLLSAVIILPLVRIFDFSLPLVFFRQVYWSMIVSIPLLIAIAYLGRNLRISLKDAGLTLGNPYVQLAIGLSGIAFGFMEYSLIRPLPMASELSVQALIVPVIVFIAFTGFTEELLFRGLIQTLATRVYGPMQGVLYSSALFTVMHIGFNSGLHLAYVMCVSLFFGYVFYRTKSLTGVVLAHGLTNAVLFLVAPFVLP